MKELLSIKEFSKLSGIETTTLRYWDDIGLFSPIMRDPENNYRYYSSDQIIAVNFVKVFSNLNTPLKVIGEMEKERTPESILNLIIQQEKLLDLEMRNLQECYSIIHTRNELINYGLKMLEELETGNEIIIETRTQQVYMPGKRNKWVEGESFHEPFMAFCNSAHELRINLGFPIGGAHDDWQGFMERSGEPHYFFSMDPNGNTKMEAGEYMVGFCRGYYGEFGDLALRMNNYAEINGWEFIGPVFSVYLHDEVSTRDQNDYLSHVYVKVEKKY